MPAGPRRSAAMVLDDQLLIASVAVLEDSGQGPAGARSAISSEQRSAAERATRQQCDAQANLAERLLHRARHLTRHADLAELPTAVNRVRRAGALVALGLVLLMGLLGYVAVTTVLAAGGEQRQVNVYWALLALLGFQSLMLVVWAVASVALPQQRSGQVRASLLGGLTAKLTSWLHRSRLYHAAATALVRTLGADPLRRWVLASFTHALWTAFNLAALVALLLMLSFRHYVFAWETTILTPEAFARLTELLGRLPAMLGLAVPSPEQVAATQSPAEAEALGQAQQAWAQLLLGAIALYGLLPRVVLLAVSVALARRAVRRRDPAAGLPEVMRSQLRRRLAADVRALGVAEAETAATPADDEPERELPVRPLARPAIVGFEIDRPRDWPPELGAVQVDDLGFVDDHHAQRQLVERLRDGPSEPAAVLVACDLPATPDRGTEHFVRQLRRSMRQPVLLLLTGGGLLRDRGEQTLLNDRLEQWRGLAERAGLGPDHCLELDLDRADEGERARLEKGLREHLADGEPPAS